MYRTHFLSKDLQKIGEYKHYAAILSHLKDKSSRWIFFANKRESPTPYFTLLEILKLENIFKLKIGALVHKIQYQKKDTPPALYDLVQPASAVHN